jgi:HSP20 family protein
VKYHRREREGGQFNRVIALPNDIAVAKIQASYSNEILSITVPRAAAARPKQISIK